jgi:hypothetical protein
MTTAIIGTGGLGSVIAALERPPCALESLESAKFKRVKGGRSVLFRTRTAVTLRNALLGRPCGCAPALVGDRRRRLVPRLRACSSRLSPDMRKRSRRVLGPC